MTLYQFLIEEEWKYTGKTIDTMFGTDKEYYKNVGRYEMCGLLREALSDETLNMEVKTRAEVLK